MIMKIQCNACEAAEANVLCCAEEAALCWACDHKIHATSKLASEHHRLPLSSSSPFPNCDICQVSVGYFFCAQDRALLCRKCDVAIHTANAFVSSHDHWGQSWPSSINISRVSAGEFESAGSKILRAGTVACRWCTEQSSICGSNGRRWSCCNKQKQQYLNKVVLLQPLPLGRLLFQFGSPKSISD